ncbi:MAG: aspartate aminotransferase family protein [Candidatus Latescibacterota bacterium]|nr:MAG: aspartate aminotransferase family protein [Candidatus Latescibacterota bacterium]
MHSAKRRAPIEMTGAEFRRAGYHLIDRIADFLDTIRERPVTTGESPAAIRTLLGPDELPEEGMQVGALVEEAANLMIEHSLFNGHPRFLGYITSSAAPIGALGDLLAASVNSNAGAWAISPVASEIEARTVRWIAELIGYPRDCGGILTSGGNMSNFIGFLAAFFAKAGWDVRKEGLRSDAARTLRVYAASTTHTWIHKATALFGLGTDCVRWIPLDAQERLDVAALEQQILSDGERGDRPWIVIGTAGSVGTGVIDPLPDIALVCQQHDVWFHVDGAYGALAAMLPDAPEELSGMAHADSVAIDPHKWLYAPLEAGCALVRDRELLRSTFSFRPEYYKFDTVAGEETLNYNEYGLQNSRGVRALKVWLALRQVGRRGYVQMIADDIALARRFHHLVDVHPELEAVSLHLSVSTFRYVPAQAPPGGVEREPYLKAVNEELLTRLQEGGEAFVSNAVVEGRYVLRMCVVNFRTSQEDIDALPEIITRIGRAVATDLQR